MGNNEENESMNSSEIGCDRHERGIKYPSELQSLCALSCIYCFVGCDAKKIVNRFAFHPPRPAHYEIKQTSRGTRYPTHSQFHPLYQQLQNAQNRREQLLAQQKFSSFTCYDVKFSTDDDGDDDEEKIVRVFFRPAPRSAKRARVIIHSHGNAMDCGGCFEMLSEIGDQLDLSVMTYDYRGYGKSGDLYNSATVESIEEDLRKVVEWATTQRGLVSALTGDTRDQFKLEDLILWGQSLGSGPATKIATEKEIGGLILECALASGTRVLIGEAKEKHSCVSPVSCFQGCEVFDNQKLASDVKCPSLVMHGLKDFEIHQSHGKLIYDRLLAREEKSQSNQNNNNNNNNNNIEKFKTYAYWSKTAGHDDVFYDNPRELIRQVQKFVRTLPTTERIENSKLSRTEKGLSAVDLAVPNNVVSMERRRENKEKKPYNENFNNVNNDLFYQELAPRKQTMNK
jgi:abhydrolase domain-containing protein 17